MGSALKIHHIWTRNRSARAEPIASNGPLLSLQPVTAVLVAFE